MRTRMRSRRSIQLRQLNPTKTWLRLLNVSPIHSIRANKPKHCQLRQPFAQSRIKDRAGSQLLALSDVRIRSNVRFESCPPLSIGDRQDRHAIPLTIKETVDEMQVTRTAAPGTHCKASGEMCLRPCRKGGSLFMTHVDPVDRFSPPQRIGKAVERVTAKAS
jgi:hypothetical protein